MVLVDRLGYVLPDTYPLWDLHTETVRARQQLLGGGRQSGDDALLVHFVMMATSLVAEKFAGRALECDFGKWALLFAGLLMDDFYVMLIASGHWRQCNTTKNAIRKYAKKFRTWEGGHINQVFYMARRAVQALYKTAKEHNERMVYGAVPLSREDWECFAEHWRGWWTMELNREQQVQSEVFFIVKRLAETFDDKV
jgi:hypothetical protein